MTNKQTKKQTKNTNKKHKQKTQTNKQIYLYKCRTSQAQEWRGGEGFQVAVLAPRFNFSSASLFLQNRVIVHKTLFCLFFLVKNYNNKGARLHQVEVVALCSWGQVIILRKWWLVTTVMKNKRERKVSSGFVLNHRCQLAKVGPGGECKYVSLFRGEFLKVC